ncbi:hypothetical protein EI94DRAFT_1705850 [Lactarius quietus]|nr:hypothetical protein EI94DRAFT_1705850 [Lactarius quietus]
MAFELFRDPFSHLVLENIPQRQAMVGSARPQLQNVHEAKEDVNVPSTIKTLFRDLYLQAPLLRVNKQAATPDISTNAEHPKSTQSTQISLVWPVDTDHAFPDSLLANKFIEEALSTAAIQVPNVEDIHVHILQDHGYCVTMPTLPQAHISIFRAEVKEHCTASVTPMIQALNHSSPAKTAELVTKLQANFNYIFPR